LGELAAGAVVLAPSVVYAAANSFNFSSLRAAAENIAQWRRHHLVGAGQSATPPPIRPISAASWETAENIAQWRRAPSCWRPQSCTPPPIRSISAVSGRLLKISLNGGGTILLVPASRLTRRQ
jgi:hypothetical protein